MENYYYNRKILKEIMYIEGKEIKKNRVKLLKNTDYFAYLDKL